MNASLQNNIEEANTRHRVEAAIQTIADEINHSDVGIIVDGIADGLSKSHRTIQQLAIGAIINALRQYGRNESFDAKNEAAKSYCQKLDQPQFPYI